uniref:Uncharacterized protein n=1 Tax=Anguilla anguilla TaxID=7936 RepID=A0A0E9TD57_ANGAN
MSRQSWSDNHKSLISLRNNLRT